MSHSEDNLDELGDGYELGNEDEEALLADDEENQVTWEEGYEDDGSLLINDVLDLGEPGMIEDDAEVTQKSRINVDKQHWGTQQEAELPEDDSETCNQDDSLHDPRLESDDDEEEQEDSEGRARFRSERSSVPSVARAQRHIPDTLESVEVPQEEIQQRQQQRRHPKWGARGMRGGPRGRGSPRGLMQQRVHPQMRVPPFHHRHPHPSPNMHQGMMGPRHSALMDQQYPAQMSQPPPMDHPVNVAPHHHHAPQHPQQDYTPVAPVEAARPPDLPPYSAPQQTQKILLNPHFKGTITDRTDVWMNQQRSEYPPRNQGSQLAPAVQNFYGSHTTRPAQIPPQTSTATTQNYYSEPGEYYSQSSSSDPSSSFKPLDSWAPAAPPYQAGYPQIQQQQHYAPPPVNQQPQQPPFHRPPPPHIINQPVHQTSPVWNEQSMVELTFHPNFFAHQRQPEPFIQEVRHAGQNYGPHGGHMVEPHLGAPAPGPRFPHPQPQMFPAPDYSMPPPSFQGANPPFDLGPRHRPPPPQQTGPMMRPPRGPVPLRHPSQQHSEKPPYQYSMTPQVGDQRDLGMKVRGVTRKIGQSLPPQVMKRQPVGVRPKVVPNQQVRAAMRGRGRGMRPAGGMAKPGVVCNPMAMKRHLGPAAVASPEKQMKRDVEAHVKQTQPATQAPVEDEDEDTKAYRLRIEEQKRKREEFLRKKELRRKVAASEKQKQLQLAQANKAVPSESGNVRIMTGEQQVGCAISTIVTQSPPKQSMFLNNLHKQPSSKAPLSIGRATNHAIGEALTRQPGVAANSGALGLVKVQRSAVGRGNTTRIVLPPRNPAGAAVRMAAPNTVQTSVQNNAMSAAALKKMQKQNAEMLKSITARQEQERASALGRQLQFRGFTQATPTAATRLKRPVSQITPQSGVQIATAQPIRTTTCTFTSVLKDLIGTKKVGPKQQNVQMIPPENMQTSTISVENLANSVNKALLLSMCQGLNVTGMLFEMASRKARITFSTIEEARTFFTKYNHRMIDLSLIRVRFV